MDTNQVVRSEASRVMRRVDLMACLLLVAMALFTCVVCWWMSKQAEQTMEVINSKDNVAIEQMFDTHALETWCTGEDCGTIRMVGAWVYSVNEDGTTTLEDEQGNLWNIQGRVKEENFLLLWLVDNHTPEVEDDEIVKIWCEWYDGVTL